VTGDGGRVTGTAGDGEGNSDSGDAALGAHNPRARLVWSVRPCAGSPVLAVAVAALVLSISFAVQLYFGSPWWGGLAFVLLALSVLPYYAVTQYELNEEGVIARGPFATQRRSWSEIRRYFPYPDGVLLSPLTTSSRLALTRGLFVRFHDNRDEVLKRVGALVGQPDGADSGPAARSGDE